MPNGYIKSKNGNPVELVDAFARNRLPITVNVAVSYTDNTTYTVTSVDRTFEELAESIDSGRQVQASITRTNSNGSVSSYVVPCVSKTASSIKFGGTLSVSQRIQGTWETSQTDILSGSDFLSISSSNTYMYKVATTLMYPDNQTSLLKTNVNPWTPTGDYQPATKKYVDDSLSEFDGGNSQYIIEVYTNGVSATTTNKYDVTGMNRTYDEIKSAFDNGDSLIVKLFTNTDKTTYIFVNFSAAISNGAVFNFSNIDGTHGLNNDKVQLVSDAYVQISSSAVNAKRPFTYTIPAESNVLTKTNTTSYTPSANYHPATKKYVDDIIGDIETALDAILGGDA